MRWNGLILVTIGVGLCAAFGARLTPDVLEQQKAEGRVAFAAKGEHEAYCAARGEAGLDPADGCDLDAECAAAFEARAAPVPVVCLSHPGFSQTEGFEAHCAAQVTVGAPLYAHCQKSKAFAETCKDEAAEGAQCKPDHAGRVAQAQAEVAALEAEPHAAALTGAVATARGEWLDAKLAHAEAKANLADVVPAKPGARLSAWLSLAGLPFLLGMALILGGAFVARAEQRKESDGADGEKRRGPADFAAFLTELRETLVALQADMEGQSSDPSDEVRDRIKVEIESIQVDRFAFLIEARDRFKLRHGIEAFATVFSPLSGAERRTNRAWSALVDRHWPEACASIKGAVDQIALADDETREVVSAFKG